MSEIEEKITIELSREEAGTLVNMFQNYIIHYTEDDYYTGEPEIPLMFARILAECASDD